MEEGLPETLASLLQGAVTVRLVMELELAWKARVLDRLVYRHPTQLAAVLEVRQADRVAPELLQDRARAQPVEEAACRA